ncbi:M23 family metallopeptidase [Bacillus sp. Marseille-P3800]|uniref:M23 family metallopeptidase n=1 Tax=Bacillus sp. Marseille-P3800 TaxID=2014782 RepID=UPI000C073367|nr:M23 family metallopeptidase [Bacillus sp. Marseille-P3800]
MWAITSKFGDKEFFRDRPHTGVDLAMEKGHPLKSLVDGHVTLIDSGTEGIGKGVVITNEKGLQFIYGHLDNFNINDGDLVKRGEIIGASGNTGFSTGPHLHFGLKENGEFINPSAYIDDLQNMDSLVVNESLSITDFIKQTQLDWNDLFQNLFASFSYLGNLFDYTIFTQLFQYFM